MIDRFKNLKEKADSLDLKTINAIKMALFIGIVIDLVGIFWYLGAKTTGTALLIVLLVGVGIIVYLERGKLDEEVYDDSDGVYSQIDRDERRSPVRRKRKMDEGYEEDYAEEEDSFDLGLPSRKEVQKRFDDAFGSGL